MVQMSKEFSNSLEQTDVVTFSTLWWHQMNSTSHQPQVSSIQFMRFLCSRSQQYQNRPHRKASLPTTPLTSSTTKRCVTVTRPLTTHRNVIKASIAARASTRRRAAPSVERRRRHSGDETSREIRSVTRAASTPSCTAQTGRSTSAVTSSGTNTLKTFLAKLIILHYVFHPTPPDFSPIYEGNALLT